MTVESSAKKSGRRLAMGSGFAGLLLVGGFIALPKLAETYTSSIKEKQARMIYGDVEAKQRRIARYEDGTETEPHNLRITDFSVVVDESLSNLIGQSSSNDMKTTIWTYLRPKDDRPPHQIRRKRYRDNKENRSYRLFIENEAVIPRKPTRQIMVKMKPGDKEFSEIIEAIGIRYKCPANKGDYTWQKQPC